MGNFWQRWHISLSTWLKDYLYIPLGGNRKGLLRTCINTMIVFVICGLWHGAAWTFVVWGALHGLLITGERIVSKVNKGWIKIPHLFSISYTYAVICISWVFFRANTMADALYILRNAPVGIKNFILPNYIFATFSKLFITNTWEIGIVLFCLVAIVLLELASTRASLTTLFHKQPAAIRFSLYTVVVALIILLRNVGPTEFIYVQF